MIECIFRKFNARLKNEERLYLTIPDVRSYYNIEVNCAKKLEIKCFSDLLQQNGILFAKSFSKISSDYVPAVVSIYNLK